MQANTAQLQGGTALRQASGRSRLVVVAAHRVRSRKNICINKTVKARPEASGQVLELCKEIVAFSEKEASDKKNGIVVFQCVKDAWEPDTFHFWERYESNVALGRHSTSPHMVALLEKMSPLLAEPVGMAMYEYEDGKIGQACVQCGPKGEGGLDDATGASGAAGGASYKQTSRTVDLTRIDEHAEAKRDEELLAQMAGGTKSQPARQQEQPVPAASTQGEGRVPGGIMGVFRTLAGHAQGFGKCVAHYVSNITGKQQ